MCACFLRWGCVSVRDAHGCSLKSIAYQAQWQKEVVLVLKLSPLVLMQALSELVMVSGAGGEMAEKCCLDSSGLVCVSLGRWG